MEETDISTDQHVEDSISALILASNQYADLLRGGRFTSGIEEIVVDLIRIITAK